MSKYRSIIWSVSKAEFIKVIEQSETISQCLEYFELVNKGSNYTTFLRRCKVEEIDCSKFKRTKGRREFLKAVPLEEVLVENSTYSRYNLKRRLMKSGLIENKCSNCSLPPVWAGKSLTMVLDHINGKNDDNRLENLRLLCPNCNSQTPTFAGRNRQLEKKCCKICGVKIKRGRTYCWDCSHKLPKFENRKVERPSSELLQKLLWEKPTTQIAKDYGVSDKSIEKWAKSYGIEKPPRGYWGFKK